MTLKPALGLGAFSVPDIALVLGIPQAKVRRMLNQVWDERFGKNLLGDTFSTTVGDHKFVNFHTLIELYVYFELRDMKVSAQRILKTRHVMQQDLGTPHPFAAAKLLTNGKRIRYEFKECIVDADGTRQTNFERMVRDYAKKIDFNGDDLAIRYWPLGKERKVVVDPLHQFGLPTVANTNINTHTLRGMFHSGESPEVLAEMFDIPLDAVKDALAFHDRQPSTKQAA